MYTYTHIHISVQIFLKRYGDFCINPCWLMRCIFFIPQFHLLPALPQLFSGTPPPQPFSTQGWLFWSIVVGKVALWHSFQHSPDWMYCSLFPVFLLWSVSCPERRNKGLEFTECLFLKSLYALPTFFFFFKEKESTVFSLFFWWRKNNTKQSPVKGNQRAGGLWISRYLDFL